MGRMRELKERAGATVPGLAAMLAALYEHKGGPGSGNWGHIGRPGSVGGSAPTSGVGGAMSLISGPTAAERQRAAAGRDTGDANIGQGIGKFGDGADTNPATDKQREYVTSLIDGERQAFHNRPWNPYNNRPADYLASSFTRRAYNSESATSEGHTVIGDVVRNGALKWLDSLNVSGLSKPGASALIDTLKGGTAALAWLTAHTDLSVGGIVDFINKASGKDLLRVHVTKKGREVIRPADSAYVLE